MKYILVLFILFGCLGDATHTVEGETKSTVEVVVKVDVSVCDNLEGKDKEKCISDLIALIKLIAQTAGKDET